MNRKVIQFLITCIQNYGIDIANEKGNKKVFYTRIIVTGIMLLYFITLTAFLLKHLNETKSLVLGSAYLLGEINLEANYLYFQLNIKRIQNMLRNIDDNIFIYTNEEKITPTYSPFIKEKNMLFLFRIILIYIIVSLTLYSLSPFLADYLTGYYLKIEAIPIWLPFQNKVAVSLIQSPIIFVCAFALYLKLIFTLFVHFEYERQTERLCAAILTLEGRSLMDMQQRVAVTNVNTSSQSTPMSLNQLRSMRRTNPSYRNIYYEIVRENLIQCIQHHQHLIQ